MNHTEVKIETKLYRIPRFYFWVQRWDGNLQAVGNLYGYDTPEECLKDNKTTLSVQAKKRLETYVLKAHLYKKIKPKK